MGRIARSAPVDSIVAVRRDPNKPDYEFYILKVTRIGAGRTLGSKRIAAEDGTVFSNLDDVGIYLARRAGFDVSRPEEPRVVAGRDILAAGKWYDFCAERKLDPGAINNLHEVFTLEPDEAKRFGVG